MDGHIHLKIPLTFGEFQQRPALLKAEVAVPKDRVLCVDDESAVRRACSVAIVEGGFQVEVADSGAAGLTAFLRRRNDICLVVSDIIMPGTINGLEMVDEILKIDSSMKVLMMAGYSDSMVKLPAGNSFPLIRKPFLQSDLLKKIQSVLGTGAVDPETNRMTVDLTGVVRGILNWLKSGAQTELEWTTNTERLESCLYEMKTASKLFPAVPYIEAMVMAMWSRNRKCVFEQGVMALAEL